MGEADPGAEALLGVLKEQSSRRLRDPGQGAPGSGEVPESSLEEVTPDLSLEEGEVKQKEIPGRVGSLRKKKKACALGLPWNCRHVQSRCSKGRKDSSSSRPQQEAAMGGFGAESGLFVVNLYRWARFVRRLATGAVTQVSQQEILP